MKPFVWIGDTFKKGCHSPMISELNTDTDRIGHSSAALLILCNFSFMHAIEWPSMAAPCRVILTTSRSANHSNEQTMVHDAGSSSAPSVVCLNY